MIRKRGLGPHMALISANALKVIEDVQQNHLLLCEELTIEELTLMEQMVVIPNVESGRVFPDRRNGIPDDQGSPVNNNFLRMQARRHLDEVAFCHGMNSGELEAHFERSIVLGDCSLCEWFERSRRGPVAL